MSLHTFIGARGGGISVLTALSSVMLIGFAGLATDVGSVYLESRRLQGTADLAALAAIQNPAQAEALATATVSANRWSHDARIRIVRGTYAPDRSIRPGERFRPNAPGPNAVNVEVTTSTPLFFGKLFIPSGRMTITRRATAAQTQLASFQIGSRLLALNGGVANQVLSGLTGSSVSLSVMDYNSLLNADVELLSFVDALRTRMNLEAGTYEETLSSRVEAPVALHALADVLAGQEPRAERAMRQLAQAAEYAGSVGPLDTLIDLGPYAQQDHTAQLGASQIQVSAMDLATAVLQIAGGDRQVRLNLGAGVPGLASTDVWLAIGERPNNSPWLAVTDDENVIIRTAQMRLFIQAQVRPAGALGALANVRLPILLEMASAQARLNSIRCGFDPRDREVTLDVAPSIGSLSLGDINTSRLDDFRTALHPTRADLVRVGPIRVQGEGRVELGGQAWQQVRFNGSDIDGGVVKQVHTRDTAQATISSLLGRTNLTVAAGGLGLSTGAVTSSVRGALTTAAAPLDGLVNGLSDLLGVRLGEADVRVNGVRCGGAALVA
ncbi:pilus assembly protein TadG-related protein [Terricaulis silvestris]|uniref:Helicase/secretion neighborhood TadE-like protein n=1 Tax=Terricaulis silvestris TaxID=2686094 RepID=A0A6I6MRR5_9CAUL|nr:pilus assembly protein TadG-related protein [Terricaulis silvestris]QGZ93833.1 helicase/secretion neighborhood TadE-like protein [Terricaulis silvestris]